MQGTLPAAWADGFDQLLYLSMTNNNLTGKPDSPRRLQLTTTTIPPWHATLHGIVHASPPVDPRRVPNRQHPPRMGHRGCLPVPPKAVALQQLPCRQPAQHPLQVGMVLNQADHCCSIIVCVRGIMAAHGALLVLACKCHDGRDHVPAAAKLMDACRAIMRCLALVTWGCHSMVLPPCDLRLGWQISCMQAAGQQLQRSCSQAMSSCVGPLGLPSRNARNYTAPLQGHPLQQASLPSER